MAPKTLIFTLILILSLSLTNSQTHRGKWKLIKRSIGISAMHMALLPNDRIITFDRTNFGPSNITLPQGKCIKSFGTTKTMSSDCYAHAIEFDPKTRNTRPLTILTDTWCSSGALSSDGVLVQTGGYLLGDRVVRFFKPCKDCDFEEYPDGLLSPRWYASNQILPNGKIIVVGGENQFSYEFVPKVTGSDKKIYYLPFLEETRDSVHVPNNLYPFLHLSPDGYLFIFANKKSILLDYEQNRVVKTYPVFPGAYSRNYPSTGSSVLLPLFLSPNKTVTAEIMICGGTLPDSNQAAYTGRFLTATDTCGRMKINSEKPDWVIEQMPMNRFMSDMILLPTGDVLIVNGAAKGTAGWGVGRVPVLNPVLYSTRESTFEVLGPSLIPRMYHSSAHLLSDGRVLVGGSNPNSNYNFSTKFPTELSLEAFYPPYLLTNKSRPVITNVNDGLIGYDQMITIELDVGESREEIESIYVTLMAPSFTTHSFSMNQRLLVLKIDEVEKVGLRNYVVRGYSPANGAIAPSGFYQLFVVHGGVPSKGVWVQVK